MKHTIFYPLLFILIIAFFSILRGDDQEEFLLRKRIVESKKRIEEFTQKTRETEKQLRDFQAYYQKQVNSGKEEITNLSRVIQNMQVNNNNLLEKESALRAAIANNTFMFSALTKSIIKSIDADKSRITQGIPYRKDDRILQLSRIQSDSHIASIKTEELFNRYMLCLHREMLLGFDSEVYTENGNNYLRIGLLIMARANNNTIAVLTRKNNQWAWDEGLNFTERNAVRDSLLMVQGKKAPHLLNLPVSLPLIKDLIKGGVQ